MYLSNTLILQNAHIIFLLTDSQYFKNLKMSAKITWIRNNHAHIT